MRSRKGLGPQRVRRRLSSRRRVGCGRHLKLRTNDVLRRSMSRSPRGAALDLSHGRIHRPVDVGLREEGFPGPVSYVDFLLSFSFL
jgi:hypothetical protein